MKIEDNAVKKIPFSELAVGDIFKDDDDDIYMKVNGGYFIEYKYFPSSIDDITDEYEVNSLNLKTHEYLAFSAGEQVYAVDATLMLK